MDVNERLSQQSTRQNSLTTSLDVAKIIGLHCETAEEVTEILDKSVTILKIWYPNIKQG